MVFPSNQIAFRALLVLLLSILFTASINCALELSSYFYATLIKLKSLKDLARVGLYTTCVKIVRSCRLQKWWIERRDNRNYICQGGKNVAAEWIRQLINKYDYYGQSELKFRTNIMNNSIEINHAKRMNMKPIRDRHIWI